MLVCAASLVILPVRGEHEVYDDVIRLHVIAASDEPADQSLKLTVRDSVLDFLSKELSSIKDRDKAERVIAASLDGVRENAEKTIAENGSDYAVSVDLSREKYPQRSYGAFSLPGGEYTSLRVTLGEGAGKNWWCIIFPSLCTANAERAENDFTGAGFSSDQYGMIRSDGAPKYRVRFRILEILSGVFGFEY